MEKITIYENGEVIEIEVDPTIPLWKQFRQKALAAENSSDFPPEQQRTDVTHRNIAQEAQH
jgi:hypothetical protein